MVEERGLAVELVADLMEQNKVKRYDEKGRFVGDILPKEMKKRVKDKEKFDKKFIKEVQKISKDENVNWERVLYETIIRSIRQHDPQWPIPPLPPS